ncbi:MAG: hypothetical protein ACOC07_01445 [Coleofasciculus sp.]
MPNPIPLIAMSEEFRQIFPTPPPAADIFATYQLTQEFHQETQYRQEFESYCQWYRHYPNHLHRKESELNIDAYELLTTYNPSNVASSLMLSVFL